MEPNYSQQLEQLEKIVREIETGEMSIDMLATKVKEATTLLENCKKRLTTVENEVNSILETDKNKE